MRAHLFSLLFDLRTKAYHAERMPHAVHEYNVVWNVVDGWSFQRTTGRRVERYLLDHDRRHARFFLRPADQRRVGVEGLIALERIARKVLGPQR